MKKLLLIALLLIPTSHAVADDRYETCMAEADGTNPAFGKCGGDWVARADARLNAVWKELMDHFSDMENARQSLLAEQRLWNAYKESSCKLYESDFGREGQVIHFPACRASVIEQRIKELEDYQSEER